MLFQEAFGLADLGLEVAAITRGAINGQPEIVFSNRLKGYYYDAPVAKPFQFVRDTLLKPVRIHRRMFAAQRPGVVIAHQPFTCFGLIARVPIDASTLVYVAHSPIRQEYLASVDRDTVGSQHLLAALMRGMVERWCIRKAAVVVTLSNYMKRLVSMEHAIHENKTVVIPGGVDLKRFSPAQDRKRVKKRLGFHDGCVHLLSIRNLEPRMGLGALIDAMAILRRRCPRIQLTIGGSGPERSSLETKIDRAGLSDVVTLAGFIPDDKLPDYYAAADWFVIPTQSLEGFGLVTLESWASGTPVVGTPVGAIPEVIASFDKRFLFGSMSAESIARGLFKILAKEFDDRDRYERLRRDVRRHAETQCDWSLHTNSLARLIAPHFSHGVL